MPALHPYCLCNGRNCAALRILRPVLPLIFVEAAAGGRCRRRCLTDRPAAAAPQVVVDGAPAYLAVPECLQLQWEQKEPSVVPAGKRKAA